MSETKTREPQFALPDQLPEDHLPESVALTPEQIAAQAKADERDRERRLEWAIIIQAQRQLDGRDAGHAAVPS
jgi:hypothetical protein